MHVNLHLALQTCPTWRFYGNAVHFIKICRVPMIFTAILNGYEDPSFQFSIPEPFQQPTSRSSCSSILPYFSIFFKLLLLYLRANCYKKYLKVTRKTVIMLFCFLTLAKEKTKGLFVLKWRSSFLHLPLSHSSLDFTTCQVLFNFFQGIGVFPLLGCA